MLKLKKLKASKLSKSRRSGHAGAPLPVTKTRSPFLAEFSRMDFKSLASEPGLSKKGPEN